MKVLRVVSDLYPAITGGVAVHSHEMSKEQVKLGHEVTVYTIKRNGCTENETIEGYKIIRFTPIITLLGNAIVPSMLIELFKNRKKYDVIHAHSHLYFSTNLCALVKLFGSAPLFITNHGLESQTAPTWFNKLYAHTIAKWTYNISDAIFCYAEEEKTKLIKIGVKPTKIHIIHNGVNTDIFTPQKERKKTNQLLWIGRYTRGKGVDYLLEGFKILSKKNPELKLMMIGWGPMKEEYLLKIGDMGLSNKITIKEFVSNNELPEIYNSSDVFILPSINEGVPRAILEAMSCAVPVVCTNLPQLLKVVDGCGITVPIKDSQAIADAVEKILSDKIYSSNLGIHGRNKVLENYSWIDTVKEVIRVYEEFI